MSTNREIRGVEKLTPEQVELMERVHRMQIIALGGDEEFEIVKVWIDEDDTLCVRLSNGEWYHYSEDLTWW